MSNLHDTDYIFKLKQGLVASINTTATVNSAVTGEPHYTTDTKKTYIFDGSNNVRVHGLDMVVCFDDESISFNNELIYYNPYA